MVGFCAHLDSVNISKAEPWRCDGCHRLMYNLDPSGKPARGAPLPNYLDEEHPKVCSLCYQTHTIFSSPYWRAKIDAPRVTVDAWAEY
jgi:hypothetical protein